MANYIFHPVVNAWFERKYKTPTPPQEHGWPAIQRGDHTLIAAPTGSGKTLAAFLASLDALFQMGVKGKLRDETYIIYVSPLKALSNDIHKNLEEPLKEIREAMKKQCGNEFVVRAAVRTGDTPQAARQAMLRKPPHILVTTPESLYLLLTSESGRKMLKTVRTLIVDEIHAVVGSRRGSHLALTMERLQHLVQKPLQRIGLSATQSPIEEVARFLVGTQHIDKNNSPACTIVDSGHKREMDLALELPESPLEAVMSNEVWEEVYRRLASLIEKHQTTLIFVNTRRMAERVSAHLCDLLGKEHVTSHHGSLSAKLRLDAETRLKQGKLKALVATSSLELGIDIGSVDLVCQLGPTRAIATCLQRVGRAEHRRGGLPKGRIFPLTRDELVECVATLQSIRRGELDVLEIPQKPMDVLAQQIVAAAGAEEWTEAALFALMRAAYPYRDLTKEEFDNVIRMLADGYTTKRGRRSAYLHHDAINHRIRGRKGARLTAITSGSAIADNADYRVVLEPAQTFIGTVNEDFAVESLEGDIFQLGNASWRIKRITGSTVHVEDAHGQPPGLPFWLGEAPARTRELSLSISALYAQAEKILVRGVKRNEAKETIIDELANSIAAEVTISEAGAAQLAQYIHDSWQSLGALPTQDTIIMERFFDESGGMQLVLHSPLGARLNRAWGLSLRKRFCASFNFELQSAATDDAIVLSLATQHSFPLEDVFHYLQSATVREVLTQAMLDAPMFAIRWRWNASRSLALPRMRGGKKLPPNIMRMESENLLASVFPEQMACLENITGGKREIPDHPLVNQTIEDCLIEAMDIVGLEALLKRIEAGEMRCIARDLPEPSALASEILNARPYAFLDDAPLEERRARAVMTRRSSDQRHDQLGILDIAAIHKVVEDAWPLAVNDDELHEVLLLACMATDEELLRSSPSAPQMLERLIAQKRTARMDKPHVWVAAEHLPKLQAVYAEAKLSPRIAAPENETKKEWLREEALVELVRGRMEVIGPVTASALAAYYTLPQPDIDQALLALETQGFILRGTFRPTAEETEWCERRLLARIHRLTINRLRAEIQPVTIADFQQFLLNWQRVLPSLQMEEISGVEAVLHQLDGYELPAAAWEPSVLSSRVKSYDPRWLDQLCFTGRFGWGRLSPPESMKSRGSGPLRSSPIALFARENLANWLELAGQPPAECSSECKRILHILSERGALFFGEIVKQSCMLQSRVEGALGEAVALGWVTADSFEGMRALLTPPDKRSPFSVTGRPRRHRTVTSLEYAGRWSLMRAYPATKKSEMEATKREELVENYARVLLRRYGVMFRKLLEREALQISWYELGRVFRRLEARGEIRGGYFISGVSGEQFALPEAIGLLRSLRKEEKTGAMVSLSAADPLNLVGILTPGARLTAISKNRLLLRNGVPIAGMEGGKLLNLDGEADITALEHALKSGHMPVGLRRYY